jgi:hypothetical protein
LVVLFGGGEGPPGRADKMPEDEGTTVRFSMTISVCRKDGAL